MDFISMTDLIITNGVLAWVGLRLVKRVDNLDKKVDDHEIRLLLNEQALAQTRVSGKAIQT